MKIFHWLHRRLYTNPEYCRVPRPNKDVYVDDDGGSVKKAETEKEALLQGLNHVKSIQQVLDGILTIGTLGHLDGQCHQGPLGAADAIAAQQQLQSDACTYREGQEEEEVEFSIAAAERPNHCMTIESFRKEMPVEEVKSGEVEIIAGEEEDLLEPLLKTITADKRERVTLADLLAAEHCHRKAAHPPCPPASAKTQQDKMANVATETALMGSSLSCSTDLSLALNKKLVPPSKKGRECSPPATKKLHQRIRRLLKRKIHPEVARDGHACGKEEGSHGMSASESVQLI